MGVFGTTYKSAFSGLGKPSIKLEFEDNEELLAFQRRIDAGDGDDGGNFTPGDRVLDSLSRLATGRPYLKATRGGEELEGTTADEEARKYDFYLLITSEIEPVNSQKFTSKMLTDFEKQNQDFKVKTPIGEVLISRKLIYGYDRHLFKHIYYYFNVLKRTLEDPICIFKSTDDKGNANKTFVKCFYMDGMELISIVSPVDPVTLDLKTTYKTSNYNQVWELVKRGGEDVIYSKKSINDVHGLGNPRIITPSIKVVEFRLPITITENGTKSCVSAEKSLDGYGDFYTVRDMRKRSRKEPGDVATNKNLQFTKDNDRKMNNFDRSLYELTNGVKSWDIPKKIKDTDWRALDVTCKSDNGKCTTSIQIFFPYKLRYDLDKPTFTGYAGDVDVEVDLNNLYNYSYYVDARNYIYKQRLEGFVKKDYYKELFIEAIKSGYKQLQQRLINIKNSSLANSKSNVAEAEKLIKYYKMFYSDPSKYDLLDKAYGGNYNNIREKVIDVAGRDGVKLDGVTLGKTASDALYNNNDILDCRGLKPTYKILQSYDAFFAPAQHSQTFAGVGLDDTKKLIADICKAHYKDCARIAQHLKGDTKLQSVFNLWHWLRHNIRYEYDREGREEVRTPLRTWADRRRGVDCDCLSVFAWCVLKCMGYDPAFELVCFKGKKQPSHILVNLDGIRCDRVWFVFNSLPPGVTNSDIYRITDRATAAQLAGLFN